MIKQFSRSEKRSLSMARNATYEKCDYCNRILSCDCNYLQWTIDVFLISTNFFASTFWTLTFEKKVVKQDIEDKNVLKIFIIKFCFIRFIWKTKQKTRSKTSPFTSSPKMPVSFILGRPKDSNIAFQSYRWNHAFPQLPFRIEFQLKHTIVIFYIRNSVFSWPPSF